MTPQARYKTFLKAYATEDEATTLAEVRMLGRELIEGGVAYEELGMLHTTAVAEVAGLTLDLTASEGIGVTSPAFIEVLMAYCLAFQEQTESKSQSSRNALQQMLGPQDNLMGWQDATVTAQMAGVGPLHERSPTPFAAMEENYASLLDQYLEAIGFGQTPPRADIRALANAIGALGGGPRDVVDLHVRGVSKKCSKVHPKRGAAYTIEGRLLALELMGFLVDYYRR